MTFEGDIASLNEHFFFEEFTYSTNTFRPVPSTELELADSIIWLDDMLVVFQLKEREKISKTLPAREARWFEKKVIGRGTRQIRDSVKYLDVHRNIVLRNHRGHRLELKSDAIAGMHKVICFLGNSHLPEVCRRTEVPSQPYRRNDTRHCGAGLSRHRPYGPDAVRAVGVSGISAGVDRKVGRCRLAGAGAGACGTVSGRRCEQEAGPGVHGCPDGVGPPRR